MMSRLYRIALITSVAFIVGCDDKANLGSSSRSPESIRVTNRTSTTWSVEYTTSEKDTLSLWTGKRENAVYVLVHKGTGSASLTKTDNGLLLVAGGNKVGPIVMNDFAFASETDSKEADGSIIIGNCNAGPVGIRITEAEQAAPRNH